MEHPPHLSVGYVRIDFEVFPTAAQGLVRRIYQVVSASRCRSSSSNRYTTSLSRTSSATIAPLETTPVSSAAGEPNVPIAVVQAIFLACSSSEIGGSMCTQLAARKSIPILAVSPLRPTVPLLANYLLLPADEFNELWHYLSAHDLQPWIFEGCQADGAPVGLLAARREYIRLINNRELLIDLSRAFREEDRQYMLTLAHRALDLTPSVPTYDRDYAPTVTEAVACNLITRRRLLPAARPRIVFER
jgi:hypothetical protein